MPALNSDTPVYQNYTNTVHRIEDATAIRPLLLFNTAVNYGIAINEPTARVVTLAASGNTCASIANDLGTSVEEILPLLTKLVSLGFLALQPTPAQRGWKPANFDIQDAENYPFEDIIVSLGDRCNLACSYCFNADDRETRLAGGATVKRLGRADIARIAREFAALGGTGMILTGGEPTLNPEFLDICEDVSRAGLKVRVITNGTRLNRLDAARLVEAVDALGVSLDSLDDAANAELWQVRKYRVADTLAALGDIGRRRRADGRQVAISLKPTLTARNIALLPDLLLGCMDSLQGCELSFDISAFTPIGKPDIDGQLKVTTEALDTALADAARAILQRDSARLDATTQDIVARAFALSSGGKTLDTASPAVISCAPSMFVTNDGNLYPCQAFEVPEFNLGNVFQASLADGFAQPRFRALRGQMSRDDIEVCGECEFRYVCTEHCHGTAFKLKGATTAFLRRDSVICKSRVARRLWTETQRRDGRPELARTP